MADFTRETLLGDLMQNEEAMKIVDKYMPGATKNPAIKMVRKFSLEKLTTIPQTGLSSEVLDKLLAEINTTVK